MLTASYFTNDRAQSITQDGITHTYGLDPLRRVRIDLLTGGDGQTHAARYPTTPTTPPGRPSHPTGFTGAATSKASAATSPPSTTTRPAPRCS